MDVIINIGLNLKSPAEFEPHFDLNILGNRYQMYELKKDTLILFFNNLSFQENERVQIKRVKLNNMYQTLCNINQSQCYKHQYHQERKKRA
ncbi:unnamed protein product [Paramecium octaurelia]|uniref:Uncharacterized protein n=1 Tax=Paramecium octaurelia TaxID=43137 RepID=A0A8S1XHD4_PAROT|nr:unnamed protein product [Paramecium octaurelia]